MKQLNLTTGKQKKALCCICSLSARLGRLRSICLGLISLGLISLGLISLSPVLSAATVDDLTFTLINEGTEYAVSDCADAATGTLSIPATYEGKPVTEIGASAFYQSKLTAIELPEGLRTIGENAFGVALIESIDLPTTLTRIDTLAFNFSKLKSIRLPAGLTDLGDTVFAYCYSLTGSVTIPLGITEIPGSLFYSTALTEVILHDGVTSIGDYAFHSTDISSVNLPSSLRTIRAGAFSRTALQSISLPSGLSFLGNSAFHGCTSLTGSVTIPRGVTVISESLFYYTALTEVILHDAVTSIGTHAFYHTDISSINLPSSLRTIGEAAFYHSDLQSISLPASLSTLGSYAFKYTPKLAEVRLEGSAPSLGNGAFDGAGTQVAGGTRFYIQYEHQSSYQNSADWSGHTFAVLGDPNAPMMEAFVLSTSLDASSTVFTIHSHGEPSNASASVLVQQRSSLTQGEWTAVDSADITVSRDSESGVVTRSFSLSPSAESGFYRLHYSASESSP